MTEPIHWSQLNGNRFITKLHPFMLLPNGYQIIRKVGNRRKGKEVPLESKPVIYDREYVIAYLMDFLLPLGLSKMATLELVTEALDRLDANEPTKV